MTAITSTAELPFEARDPWALLGVDPALGEPPDEEWDAYGYARLHQLSLEGAGAPGGPLADALVLALHSEDDAPALDADVELAFWFDERDDEGRWLVLTAPLSTFLAAWLPRLLPPGAPDGPRALVLALCNPHRTPLPRPPSLPPGVDLWYPLGTATGWAETTPDEAPRFGLTAPTWVRA